MQYFERIKTELQVYTRLNIAKFEFDNEYIYMNIKSKRNELICSGHDLDEKIIYIQS